MFWLGAISGTFFAGLGALNHYERYKNSEYVAAMFAGMSAIWYSHMLFGIICSDCKKTCEI